MNFISTSLRSGAAMLLTLIAGVTFNAAGFSADDPLAAYYGNTLLCQNQSSKAICHLWLNPDRSFFLMYDRGVQKELPVTDNGNYRIEGRRGSYELKGTPGAYEVCMQPEVVRGKQFAIERDGEAYAASACYVLPEHKVGESWMQTVGGKQYKMWLVKGHG